MNEQNNEKVTAKDYQNALDVQSACNLGAIVHSFSRVMKKLQNEGHGTDWINNHPITRMYAEQIAHLTQGKPYPIAYNECEIVASTQYKQIIIETKGKEIYLNGKLLTPERSLKVRNHSPHGFSWGYYGSGPAQLALAILLECTTEENAIKYYQQFKDDFIAPLSGDYKLELNIENYLSKVQQMQQII